MREGHLDGLRTGESQASNRIINMTTAMPHSGFRGGVPFGRAASDIPREVAQHHAG